MLYDGKLSDIQFETRISMQHTQRSLRKGNGLNQQCGQAIQENQRLLFNESSHILAFFLFYLIIFPQFHRLYRPKNILYKVG
jgi:hypothetical protein